MNLTSTVKDGSQIITVNASRIDAAIAIRFKEDMHGMTRTGPDRIILDLTSVDFIDSSGLGAIVAAMKNLEPHRRIDLAGLNPSVDKVFRLTRMDTVFHLFPSLEDAVAAQAG